jgi:hypothetical protein
VLAYRKLDEVLGLTTTTEADFYKTRKGKSSMRGITALLQQPVYGHLFDILYDLIGHFTGPSNSRSPTKLIIRYENFPYQAASWDKSRQIVAGVVGMLSPVFGIGTGGQAGHPQTRKNGLKKY